MAVCGPKLSLCCLLLSVWGVIQLGLMGIFFYVKSVALVEDLELGEYGPHEYQQFYADVDQAYSQSAYNCWIAACLYIGTFLFSAQQFYSNNKSSSSPTAF
ncbi:ribonuclease kappa [Folsomia candida]|uniref:ribonuclease kappa n=1 Tax=Folsomia candida TaxID=158441 RepID=UPI000B9024AB|nr:ribonuclease kappa [Folsomia candida]XP_035706682.1 ribonuclease kappa [Folsomia candida]